MLISGTCDNGKSYNRGDDRRATAGDQAQCRFACRPYRFTRDRDSLVVLSASVFNHRRFCLCALAIDPGVSPHKNEGSYCRETKHWGADQLSQQNRYRLSETASRRNFRDTGIEFTHDLLLVYQAVNSAAHTLIAQKICERAAAGRYEWRFAMKY